MTHDHARRDGLPVTDPDLCFICARAELRSMRVGLSGSPCPAKDDQRPTGASTAAALSGPMVARPTHLLTA